MGALKVVAIGGGHSLSVVLKALRKEPTNKVITGICGNHDSGGFTGKLQKDYDANAYLGDYTRAVAALCPNEALERAMVYRFGPGCIKGMSPKNMLQLACEKTSLNPDEFFQTLHYACHTGLHRVIPVTKEKASLKAITQVGNELSEETELDTIADNPLWHPDLHKIKDVYLKPRVKALPEAIGAIDEANVCIFCPGDTFTSIIPVLQPMDVVPALQKNKSMRIIICIPLYTKRGETHRYCVKDYVEKIMEPMAGYRDYDSVIHNTTKIPEEATLPKGFGGKVHAGSFKNYPEPRFIQAPLLMLSEEEGTPHHDPTALAQVFSKIFRHRDSDHFRKLPRLTTAETR